MINGEYFKSGSEGILYRCNDGSLLKVFHGEGRYGGWISKEKAEREFSNMKSAYEKGINIPKPIELVTIFLEENDIKPVKKIRYNSCGILGDPFPIVKRNRELMLELVGETRYAIKREYLEGHCLSENFFPNINIKKKVKDLNRKIDKEGFILLDRLSKNLLITPKEEVYIVDCSDLVPVERLEHKVRKHIFARLTPTCKLEDIFMTILYNLYNPAI